MKIKVLKEIKNYKYSIRFGIESIEDEEILRIAKLSPISIKINPWDMGILFESGYPLVQLGSVLTLRNIGNNKINLDDLYNIEYFFKTEKQADDYANGIIEQFNSEMERIMKLDKSLIKEEIYEIKSGEELKKIYEGATKVLDKNTEEYKQIVEKNREAWKKLADL